MCSEDCSFSSSAWRPTPPPLPAACRPPETPGLFVSVYKFRPFRPHGSAFELWHALFFTFTYASLKWTRARYGALWWGMADEGVRTTWRCACQVNNGSPQHPHSTSKGLNYNRLLQINRSLKPAIIRMYTISIGNCTRWKTILSIVNDWQFVSTGENWRPSFHRLGLPQNNRQTISSFCFV